MRDSAVVASLFLGLKYASSSPNQVKGKISMFLLAIESSYSTVISLIDI